MRIELSDNINLTFDHTSDVITSYNHGLHSGLEKYKTIRKKLFSLINHCKDEIKYEKDEIAVLAFWTGVCASFLEMKYEKYSNLGRLDTAMYFDPYLLSSVSGKEVKVGVHCSIAQPRTMTLHADSEILLQTDNMKIMYLNRFDPLVVYAMTNTLASSEYIGTNIVSVISMMLATTDQNVAVNEDVKLNALVSSICILYECYIHTNLL